ncbi:unnamed protein product [Bursaphelenchus okinawaensis]|uniref:Cysteine-rich PDZ-binding protein n=1 Tax=Bursaphelenchus okinawaensis TaxID=465554 RepID=A0A811JTS2_9BILA|nr:unnamed protein product [Bursaphelenchus okinawaensis]CAG9082723.1 unnamed protein product [Bursaphelenchus okinawaensis]
MVCEKCTSKLTKLATIHKGPSSSKKVTNENKLLTSKARFKPEKETFKKCRICKKMCHHVAAHYCQDCAYQKGICPMCGKKVLETNNYRQSLV